MYPLHAIVIPVITAAKCLRTDCCIIGGKEKEDTGKEEINVFYNQEKGGVDSHDQMCSLYTTARKQTVGQ